MLWYQMDTLSSPCSVDKKIEAKVAPAIKSTPLLLIQATTESFPCLLLMANAPTAEIAEPSLAALVVAMQQLTLALNGQLVG